MPLAGTFDVLDFDEVLGLLSRRSATGRLHLRTGAMHGIVWLAEGQATAAEIGTSSSGETRTKWRSQLDEICFDALRSPRGSFEFHPEDVVSVPAGPRVRIEDLLENAHRRMDIWHDVESVIHSFEAVPRLAEALSDENVTVSQELWKVLVAVDGRRNINALSKRLDIEILEFCQLLKPLVESGAVVLAQPEGWLKSLPKVRLEPGGGEIDPALLVDAGTPEEGTKVLSVSSSTVPAADVKGSEVRGPDPGAPEAGGPAVTDPPTTAPPSGQESAPDGAGRPGAGGAGRDTGPRRLLRARSRSRPSEDQG